MQGLREDANPGSAPDAGIRPVVEDSPLVGERPSERGIPLSLIKAWRETEKDEALMFHLHRRRDGSWHTLGFYDRGPLCKTKRCYQVVFNRIAEWVGGARVR